MGRPMRRAPRRHVPVTETGDAGASAPASLDASEKGDEMADGDMRAELDALKKQLADMAIANASNASPAAVQGPARNPYPRHFAVQGGGVATVHTEQDWEDRKPFWDLCTEIDAATKARLCRP